MIRSICDLKKTGGDNQLCKAIKCSSAQQQLQGEGWTPAVTRWRAPIPFAPVGQEVDAGALLSSVLFRTSSSCCVVCSQIDIQIHLPLSCSASLDQSTICPTTQ